MIAEPNTEITDDEWREEKFSQEQLIGARLNERFGKTTFTQLKGALEKYGPDGILETAILLPRQQYEELEKLCKADSRQSKRGHLRRAK